jgi:enterochelin esterase-like enzyme
MRKASFVIAALLLATHIDTLAQPAIRVDSLYSPSLGRTMKICVMVPSDYSPLHKYPLLFMLHYWGGNYMTYARTKLTEYMARIPMIVVTPQADTSWHINSFKSKTKQYETYVIRDVYNYVRRKYSIDTTRQAIAGLSMGGYGALLLGFSHPKMFKFIGSLSGAITVTQLAVAARHSPAVNFVMPSIKKIFYGASKGFIDSNDVFKVFHWTPPSELPYVFIGVGYHDQLGLWQASRALADSLRSYGATYEYSEVQGDHFGPNVFTMDIPTMLQRIREELKF